ncbi:MAG: UDP-3-O-(3-hydroxymyristoyl)glucosamine N-acyltransferase [Chitinophagia bacterium]|nr:UDP-3-O-(3-hydroxymyristoyl)glucosamine N-acyltransferase [Chitinophagia bacterium]
MQFAAPVSVAWLANFTGAVIVGNDQQHATGINEIHGVVPGDICFVDFEKYYQKCLQSAATIILIDKAVECPPGKTLLVTPQPFVAYNKITAHFRPFQRAYTPISPTATIGSNTHLQPGVVVGHHVSIGSNCIIHPNVVIYDHCVIGNNVVIHANTVIGSDAFYFKRTKTNAVQYDKMLSCGRVVIEDHVEIGACCTIDRGVSADTIIGRGTKLDNQVHIGHDTVIDKNVLIAGQVGVAGVAHIEDEVILWGQVGVNKDLTIGKGTVIYAQSGVASSLPGNKTYFGSPVLEAKAKMKEIAWLKRLPEIWEKLKKES